MGEHTCQTLGCDPDLRRRGLAAIGRLKVLSTQNRVLLSQMEIFIRRYCLAINDYRSALDSESSRIRARAASSFRLMTRWSQASRQSSAQDSTKGVAMVCEPLVFHDSADPSTPH